MGRSRGDLSVRPVEDILSQNSIDATGDTAGTETLIFAMLGDEDLPDALKKSLKVFFWAGGYGASIALLVIFWSSLGNPLLKAGAMSAVLALGLLVLITAKQRQMEVRRFADSLRKVLREITKIRDGLRAYQADLDKRTSKYFHCVTHNKIRSYFVIIQLIAALTRRVELLEGLLQDDSVKNVRAAHELLHRHLTFTDGATKESGHVRKVQLIYLSKVVQELTENLDRSLDILERQLNIGPNGQQIYFDDF
jgi:hypothetical protein